MKADAICRHAQSQLKDDATASAQLDRYLDAALNRIFIHQLHALRDEALERFKSDVAEATAARARQLREDGGDQRKPSPGDDDKTRIKSDFECMVDADTFFAQRATESIRRNAALSGDAWDYTRERKALLRIMNDYSQQRRHLADTQLRAARQQAQLLQYVQVQSQQLEQLQQQVAEQQRGLQQGGRGGGGGPSGPWTIGANYQIPNTNLNLQANVACEPGQSLRQARANIAVTCMPDEAAPNLGPRGFTHGIGPGNLGLTFNFNG